MLIKNEDFSTKTSISNATSTTEHKIITSTKDISPDFIKFIAHVRNHGSNHLTVK